MGRDVRVTAFCVSEIYILGGILLSQIRAVIGFFGHCRSWYVYTSVELTLVLTTASLRTEGIYLCACSTASYQYHVLADRTNYRLPDQAVRLDNHCMPSRQDTYR